MEALQTIFMELHEKRNLASYTTRFLRDVPSMEISDNDRSADGNN